MNVTVCLLAEIQWRDLVTRWHSMTPAVRDRVVILGALAFVTLIVFLIAVFFRKREGHSHSHRRSRRYRHHHHHEHESESPGSLSESDEDRTSSGSGRRRRRRRRRPHRPLNPTLAQTGGLPPIRAEKPSEPAA